MPGLSPADVNLISPQNSAVGINLGANGFFNGTVIDVSDYITITITAAGVTTPNPNDALQIEWYDGPFPGSGVFVSLSVFGSNGQTFQTVHSTIRTSHMRVRYHAAGGGQTNLHLQTLLRKGTISGGVAPVGIITGTPDAQVVNGVLFAKTPAGGFSPMKARVDDFVTTDFWLGVVPPPNRHNVIQRNIAASLTSVQLSSLVSFANSRRFVTIFNDSDRGSLFVKLGAAATSGNFDYKVPPQHLWTMPESWTVYSDTIFGFWDEIGGTARMTEAI